MDIKVKQYNTIGCCGIDCGLCPRFHTKGESVCPGCCGVNFNIKHPPCSHANCCARKHELEVCSNCKDYPCEKFNSIRNGYDSFVTHKRIFNNINYIKHFGIKPFVAQQNNRIAILRSFLTDYDDGRSKSFFCLCCALLPIDELDTIYNQISSLHQSLTLRERNKILRDNLISITEKLKIELKLVTKQKTFNKPKETP